MALNLIPLLYLSLCVAIVYFFYYLITKKNDYWKKKGIPHLAPSFLFGNYQDYILLKKSAADVAQEICEQFPDTPWIGTYFGTEPALIVQEPEVIRQILVKDFYYFSSREAHDYSDRELVTQSFFFLGGDPWKVARHNLTPVLSSAKLKNMFYLIENCTNTLEKLVERELQNSPVIEIKNLMARFTMDCIGSCVFGIQTGTMDRDHETNPFTVMGNKIFQESTFGGFSYMCRSIWPAVFYGLGLKMYDSQISTFFRKLLSDVFESRQKEQTQRSDFIESILVWKNKSHITAPSLSNGKSNGSSTAVVKVTDDMLVAQCILFFAGGYDTTSVTIAFTIFEIAKNRQIQQKVVEEVDKYFKQHDGKIEYECLQELKYLDACIDETLRMYPLLGLIPREVMEDYTFSSGLTLEKGLRVHIPVKHIHYNARFYPNPNSYRPERFMGNEKKMLTPYTFLPFGEGPRICIGLRFAKMVILASLLTIFKQYTVELAENMPHYVKMQPKAFNTKPVGGINVMFISRNI